jgi:hypothetical protein
LAWNPGPGRPSRAARPDLRALKCNVIITTFVRVKVGDDTVITPSNRGYPIEERGGEKVETGQKIALYKGISLAKPGDGADMKIGGMKM